MNSPSVAKHDTDKNLTLDLLISAGEVTENEIQNLREKLASEFRVFFEEQTKETQMTLAALYAREPKELAKLLSGERFHIVGVHEIRNLLNVLLNIVPDLREKVNKAQ